MKVLLRLKHWQVFTLLIGVPFGVQLVVMVQVALGNNPLLAVLVASMLMALPLGLFLAWVYVLGTSLPEKLPPTVTMKPSRLKVSLFVFLADLVAFGLFAFSVFSAASSGGQPRLAWLGLIVPLHFFAMACLLYCQYFNAKALKAAEWQRPVAFSDFAGEFFLLLCLPVGIWMLQPRINQLFDPASVSGPTE